MCKSLRQYNIKDTNKYIYPILVRTYYNIWQDVNETCPHTTLYNMGAHLGSSNKRRIQRKILTLFIIEENLKNKIFNSEYMCQTKY